MSNSAGSFSTTRVRSTTPKPAGQSSPGIPQTGRERSSAIIGFRILLRASWRSAEMQKSTLATVMPVAGSCSLARLETQMHVGRGNTHACSIMACFCEAPGGCASWASRVSGMPASFCPGSSRYHRKSRTCTTQGRFSGARCYETRLAVVPRKLRVAHVRRFL